MRAVPDTSIPDMRVVRELGAVIAERGAPGKRADAKLLRQRRTGKFDDRCVDLFRTLLG